MPDIDLDLDLDLDLDADSTSGPGTSEGDIRPLGAKIPWPPKGDGPWDPVKNRIPLNSFPRHYWDPWRYAFVTIEEFTQTSWKNEIDVQRPTADEIDAGIKEILLRTDSRSGVRRSMMAEIVAQRSQATRYWRAMLMFNSRSHPWTYQLMQTAHHVGRFLAMYYKAKFNIPRPSQLSPAILPWIDPPPHPSFPSGHALEGMLISRCLGDVIPEAKEPLISLAERVGRNREVAGLHYYFDTDAGFKIAGQAFPLLETCPSYVDISTKAKNEWDGLREKGSGRNVKMA